MEKFPAPKPPTPESASEKILSSQEVLAVISQFAEGYRLVRELSDEQGLYLLEVELQGERVGETTEYMYVRKGLRGPKNGSTETVINVTYYEDGIPVTGTRAAILDEETGEWRKT